MTTVAGVSHRLNWVDRHAGYRMRCSCGWVDSTRRSSETNALNVANGHIRSVQKAEAKKRTAVRVAESNAKRAAMTPQERRKTMIPGIIVLVVAAALATVIGIVVYHDLNNPYTDGQNYGGWHGGAFQTTTNCSGADMVSAGDPNDNYSEWAAGCRNGANLPNNTGPSGSGGKGPTGNTANT
jgi:hypothetical protein